MTAPSGILGPLWNKHEGQVWSSHLLHNKEPIWRPGLLVRWCWSTQPASLLGLNVCSILSEVQASGLASSWCLCWKDGGPEMCKQNVFAAPASQHPGHHLCPHEDKSAYWLSVVGAKKSGFRFFLFTVGKSTFLWASNFLSLSHGCGWVLSEINSTLVLYD